MADNIIRLKSGGKTFDAFQEVVISKSMLTMSGQFALSTYDFYESNKKDWFLDMNSLCDVYINDERVCYGYLDDLHFDYGPGRISLAVKGRDFTQDLIDCEWNQNVNEWKKQTIRSIISNLCSPFNITVVVDADAISNAGVIIDTFKMNEGEKVSDEILRLCKDYGILPICYGDGYLTLTNSSTTRKANDGLEMGKNVHHGKFVQSNRERFSSYTVKGYGVGNDNKTPADYINPIGIFNDSTITRYRPFVNFTDGSTDSGKCINKAKWEASIRAGLSRAIFYVTRSWTQSNGRIWGINSEVRVKDKVFDIDETRLIYEVRYGYDRERGEYSIIGTVHKDTFKINNSINMRTGFDT